MQEKLDMRNTCKNCLLFRLFLGLYHTAQNDNEIHEPEYIPRIHLSICKIHQLKVSIWNSTANLLANIS